MPTRRGKLVAALLSVAALGVLGLALASGQSSGATAAAVASSRDRQRVSDLQQVRLALMLYTAEKGDLPTGLESLVPNYLDHELRDPRAGQKHNSAECLPALAATQFGYRAVFNADRRTFALFACMESGPSRVLLVSSYE